MLISVGANNMLKFILMASVFFALISCGDNACVKKIKLERGHIGIPCQWSYKKESPVDDFVVYSFVNSFNVEVLFLYVGNHASPVVPDGVILKTTEKKYTDYTFKEVVWSTSEDHFSGVVDIEFTSYGWPEMIQFSYSGLDSSGKNDIDTIISAFSLK